MLLSSIVQFDVKIHQMKSVHDGVTFIFFLMRPFNI